MTSGSFGVARADGVVVCEASEVELTVEAGAA
jgi:hypothetical protein